ncbi:J domain-containing protein [Stenotrophomonas maltophilia]|uniref:J domain-containing protein n=1 Tax=Stenotrophomonas maltophilia TaxID=40324 RepID=UPI001F5369E8|nr:J domain-containing protein [Stenotrophomonas maltophilia]MCI1140802.1 J domain-containing protein [Stenotrophomonas maltophilia]
MRRGLDVLELDEDADERAIKRAYARLLRVTRPDDDPVAFQHLHEAYQSALSWVKQRAQPLDIDQDKHALPPMQDPSLEPASRAHIDAIHAAIALDRQLEQEHGPYGHDPVRIVQTTPMPPADTGLDKVVEPSQSDPHGPDALPTAHALAPQPTLAPAGDGERSPLRSVDQMVAAILIRLAAAARGSDDDTTVPALETWLQAQPELWSLHDKPLIAASLLEQLREASPPLPREVVEHVASSFGWDDIGNGLDAEDLQRIVRRCDQAWMLTDAGRQRLAWHVSRLDTSIVRPDMRPVLDRLRRPRSRWRNLLESLPWSRPDITVLTLAALRYWPDRELPPGLSATQVAFWSRFGSRQDPLRSQVAALRAWLAGLLCGTICLVGVINSWPLASTEGGMTGGAKAALSLAIGTLLIPFGWYLICGLQMLISWQVNPVAAGSWRQVASLPVTVVVGAGLLLLFQHESFPDMSGILLARGLVFALWLVAFIGTTTQRQRLGMADHGALDRVSMIPGLIFPWLGLVIVLGYWARTQVLRRRSPQ